MKKANCSGIFIVFFAVAFLVMAAAAIAHEGGSEESEIAIGKELFDSGVSCDELGNEQLEAIGEYLMEQMHPGDAHDVMHRMMGIEEGTPYHDQFHINLAQAMYCDTGTGVGTAIGSGGIMGAGTVAGRMMPMMRMMQGMGFGQNTQGMMGSSGYSSIGSGYWTLTNILYVILLLGLVGLVYFWLLKMWKGAKGQSHTAARRKHGK
ncbi:hypothetical protein HYU16_02590 [Candidatus Woesearchaeota archaeon]|nr:hypothetical protein [Candidatus Woesearchaeota archaeon]